MPDSAAITGPGFTISPMRHRYHKPNQGLTDYVRTVLVVEGSEPADDAKPLFASGMPALVCHTAKGAETDRVLKLVLFGKSAPAESWEARDDETIIAYFFRPFALACLFNVSAVDLARSPIDLSDWNAHKTNALKTQLAYARTTDRKIEALDNILDLELTQQKHQCEIIRYATDHIMNNSVKEVLSEILHDLHLTERTFQRMFKKFVGVTPNQYRRICQFHLSFTQLRSGQFEHLTDVAFDSGFTDQSHFIRSFKEFTQQTPGDYLKAGLKRKKS